MKSIIIVIALMIVMVSWNAIADETEYPAYYRVATVNSTLDGMKASVTKALASYGFDVIGAYHPAANPDLYVLCYTRKDLADITLDFKDRGALASVLKVGLKKNGENIVVSMINPEYIFYAYLYEGIDPYVGQLTGIAKEIKLAMSDVGSDFEPFGGAQTRDDLEDYHYKVMMPYFTDPEELAEYGSFEEGLAEIRKNLEAKKGSTIKVYEVVYPESKVAVFGIGLLDPEEGEAEFLPVIGDDHIAALPYEIILQEKELTMLPGRYRIALHWPELTMGTFMKIMSTPGNIEDFMEEIAGQE
ncbi:MAG TPA: hypothetical protein VK994_01615 [Bacteroidales bacterium]|nr:hypothetical protein [Bacteroidales bacterium]